MNMRTIPRTNPSAAVERKHRFPFAAPLAALVAYALFATAAAPAQAADVSMTDSDGGGTSSFNTAGQWDDGTAPHSGNDYFTGANLLRTPDAQGTFAFEGDSLTVNDGMMLYKSGNDSVITVDDLILDNGAYYMADDSLTATSTLAGGITLLNEGDIAAFSRSDVGNTLTVSAVISGTGNLNVNRHGASFAGVSIRLDQGGPGGVRFSGANTYSGDTNVSRGFLRVQDGGTLGTGDVTLDGPARLILDHDSAIADTAVLGFRPDSFIQLDGAAGTSQTVVSLLFDDTTSFTDGGTYTADELNAIFGTNTFSSANGMTLTIPGGPGDWANDYSEFAAPVDLNFGTGQDGVDGMLIRRPDDFTVQENSLRYEPTSELLLSNAVSVVVSNYQEAQDFSLETSLTLGDLSDPGENRVGFAVLGGPHNPPDEVFNILTDSGFYGLVWTPANEAGDSVIQVREGFNGPVLAEAIWEGRQPFGGDIALQEDFEDAAFGPGGWTRGGLPSDLWEIGEPASGPGSAVSGSNVAATGLGQAYPDEDSNAWLRSPVVDLTGAAQAMLRFSEYTDLGEPGETLFNSTTLTIREPGENGAVLAEIFRRAEVTDGWEARTIQLPPEALDREVVLEFRFEAWFNNDQHAGWFIDDIQVSSQATTGPATYSLQADGVFDFAGGLDLTFSLSDGETSQSVSTFITEPHTGNAFGIGGRARSVEDAQFDFDNFSLELGDEPGVVLPGIDAPFAFAFGSDDGRDEGGEFLRNREEDWTLTADALRWTTDAADFQTSIANTLVRNFQAEETFLLEADVVLSSLDGSAGDNRVGLVLFGDEDPAVFDAADDQTYYSFLLSPDGGIAFREGMNGPIIAETLFADLDNPPEATAGASYQFRFAGWTNGAGAFQFAGVVADDSGGVATLTGSLPNAPDGKRFGFGGRHRAAEGLVWDFHTFSWSETLPPLTMPVQYQFGTDSGRDSDEEFAKAGPAAWSLEPSSLQANRSNLLGSSADAASAPVIDYTSAQEFAVRTTVSASEADTALEFRNGSRVETNVNAADLGIDGANVRTVEVWGYARNFDNNATLWSMGDRTSQEDFTLRVRGNENEWLVNMWGSGNDLEFEVPNSQNRWVHFAVVYDGTNVIVYADGEEVANEPRTVNTSDLNPVRMGHWYRRGDDQGLDGAVRDLRIWNTVRTQAEIQADMHSRLSGSEPNLVAYWPVDDGIGETVRELVEGNDGTLVANPDGALPEWRASSVGLTFLGDNESAGSAYSFHWQPEAGQTGGLLRFDGPGGALLSSVELGSVAGAPAFEAGTVYTLELTGTFGSGGSLSLSGRLSDGNGGEADLTAQVSSPSHGTWFGMAGRNNVVNWHTFEMGTPEQLGTEPPPPPEGGTYADWREANFDPEDRDNDEISGRYANPTGDGIINLLKYAFGIDPMTAVTMSDLKTVDMSNGRLRITYRERRDAEDIEYQPQASGSLASLWSAADVHETHRTPEGDFDVVTVEADYEDAERAFLRVMIIER